MHQPCSTEGPRRLEFYGTMGPCCQKEETFSELFSEGMTGIRLNLSHTGLNQCGEWLDAYFRAADRAGVHAGLLIDLQGPELRAGAFEEPVALKDGTVAVLGRGGIPVPAPVLEALRPGQEILLDDGRILLRAEQCAPHAVQCLVKRGGMLSQRKSIALPGCALHPPTLTAHDLANLALAPSCGVNGVMLPFVRDGADLSSLRKALADVSAGEVQIFAKIENREGMEHLSQLLPFTDAVVIARGDLGNDIPLWELPAAQKRMAADCRLSGTPFMVVTQLLHSMQQSAVPTRAEVSDIFNAVLDGASSLMLTGETAVGKYPARAMRYLRRTAEEALRYSAESRLSCYGRV